jgi:molecular chaperone HscC
VTLMEIFEGTLEIIATAGESSLGGEDFTDRLVAIVLERLGTQLETAELKQPLLVARLRLQCEQAKCSFAQEEVAYVRIPDNVGDLNADKRRVKVTRKSFKSLSGPLMDRLQRPVGRVLRDSGINPGEIQDVILVGGATRMFLVREFVSEFLKAEPLCQYNPDEVVALGAAVQAALIEDHAAVDDMVMTDVCPFTLGVETAREVGGRIMEGYYTPIIHRNTTIPVSREEVFHTLYPNQREVLLSIYQGEARKVKDNLKLGELRVTGIRPGPPGAEVYVRFTYDLNGILEVEAMSGKGGHKQRCVITSSASTLSQEEIDNAVQRMQELKFYPREDTGNQRLLRFAERMIGEISPMHRDQLDAAIQVFEHAMQLGDRRDFEDAKQLLLMTFSSLGINPDEYETERNESD